MTSTFLILGGYGNAGRLLAHLLLAEPDLHVVLAGRDRVRAQAAADRLNVMHPGRRAHAARLDAANVDDLRAVFRGVDLVVVASSTIRQVDLVAGAALDAGIDYLDLQLSSDEKLEALRSLEPHLREAGRCFVTDAGFEPGMPGVLVRHAARRFDELTTANVSSCMRVDWNAIDVSEATAREFAEVFKHYRPHRFVDGRWVERWTGYRHVDFGSPFGRQATAPMYLDELARLPELVPGLRETGFFVAGFDAFTDYVTTPLGLLAFKLFPEGAAEPVAKTFTWSLRRFSRPPFGVVMLLEASGTVGGEARSYRLRVAHEDGYHLTAAAVAATLRQYLRGHRPPGLRHQATYVEPAAFLDDLRRMGVDVKEKDLPGPGQAWQVGSAEREGFEPSVPR